MEDLTKNYKTLIKKSKAHKKFKDLPCSWIARINIVKMSLLAKAIYRFNAIPIKITILELEELIRRNSAKIHIEP